MEIPTADDSFGCLHTTPWFPISFKRPLYRSHRVSSVPRVSNLRAKCRPKVQSFTPLLSLEMSPCWLSPELYNLARDARLSCGASPSLIELVAIFCMPLFSLGFLDVFRPVCFAQVGHCLTVIVRCERYIYSMYAGTNQRVFRPPNLVQHYLNYSNCSKWSIGNSIHPCAAMRRAMKRHHVFILLFLKKSPKWMENIFRYLGTSTRVCEISEVALGPVSRKVCPCLPQTIPDAPSMDYIPRLLHAVGFRGEYYKNKYNYA